MVPYYSACNGDMANGRDASSSILLFQFPLHDQVNYRLFDCKGMVFKYDRVMTQFAVDRELHPLSISYTNSELFFQCSHNIGVHECFSSTSNIHLKIS